MTDHPSTTSQPSMDDILASIRRIIDDEDVKTPPVEIASRPQETAATFDVDDDAAAVALAEYDAAMAVDALAGDLPDPAEESIFPQRDGALWRRVAGHPLSEGETDPLAADDTLELTEMVDDSPQLNGLLDSTAMSASESDEELLEETASSVPTEADPSSFGIGAMTAAGVGAAGLASGSLMDRIAGRASQGDVHDNPDSDESEDDILDLTRSIDADGSIGDLASARPETSQYESGDLPPPIFERVELESSGSVDHPSQGEDDLDQSFETAAVTGLQGDYSDVLSGDADSGDARERALDDRFYSTDESDEQPPEIQETYSMGLGSELTPSRDEGAPTEDEMETVGGLVRDALRGKLPAVPQNNSPGDALVTGGAEESAARSLAALARYDAHAPRRIYGGIKITDDDDSPTIEGMVQDTLRPMLRDWLNDNLPALVEGMVKQEVDRISARSRRFVRDDED